MNTAIARLGRIHRANAALLKSVARQALILSFVASLFVSPRVMGQTWAGFSLIGQLGSPAGGGAAEIPAPPPAPPSPAVQAILATNPTFPWECARAARILADLGEIDLAKGFLKKILAEIAAQDELTRRETLLDLEARFGLEMFYQMALRPELGPEARQLAEAVGQAVEAHRRDVDRLRKLVGELRSEDARQAAQAAEDLRRAGGFAVGPILEGLAENRASPDTTSAHFERRALGVLKELGEGAEGPLRAVLQGGPEPIAAEAARVVGHLQLTNLGLDLLLPALTRPESSIGQRARQSLVALYGEVPEPDVAATLLVRRVRELLAEATAADPRAVSPWWYWDGQKAALDLAEIPLSESRKRQAVWLSTAAAEIAPNHPLAPRYKLVCQAELAGRGGSLQEITQAASELAQTWQGVSAAELVQVYILSLEHQLPIAGALTLAVLAGRAGDRMLMASHVDPSPVVEALRRPDRRVRFFAATAVLQHAEDCHFAGASWLGETVRFFLSSEGKSRALIATANTPEAMSLAGFLIQLGFEVDVARSGREAFRLLTNSPDFELAFLDLGIDDPPVDTLVQQLATDCRSALVPLGIWARAGTLDRARQVATRSPLAQAFSRPHSPESLKWQVDQLRQLSRGGLLTCDERRWVAQTLMQQLVTDVNRTNRLMSLSRLEPTLTLQLQYPERATAALTLLGAIGSATAQASLLQFASRQSVDEPLRREAVRVFAETVARHGILLTTKQIERQYELYNQLGPTSPVDREILGAILDAIEGQSRPGLQVGAFGP